MVHSFRILIKCFSILFISLRFSPDFFSVNLLRLLPFHFHSTLSGKTNAWEIAKTFFTYQLKKKFNTNIHRARLQSIRVTSIPKVYHISKKRKPHFSCQISLELKKLAPFENENGNKTILLEFNQRNSEYLLRAASEAKITRK